MDSLTLWSVILYPVLVDAAPDLPAIEYVHHPPYFSDPARIVNGTALPGVDETPDFRFEEEPWLAHWWKFYKEQRRPYRMSPHYKQSYRWNYWTTYWGSNVFHPEMFGCYCTTVYKRLTPLAGCAVLTTRHILTTATSTELVLQHHREEKHLEKILGAWYDIDGDVFNSSIYMAPARIHYHPRYLRPHEVNGTHPLPFVFDLAVWASTRNFFGTVVGFIAMGHQVVTCSRGGPHGWEHVSSTPRYNDFAVICGFQYIKSGRKNPMPWFKYCTMSKEHVVPCPKTEWGWFHCIYGSVWGRYGVESGAAWHRALQNRYWLYDGLIGLNAFSLHLRSEQITHYFTVLNTHPVLDWLYNAYMGRQQYEWLDAQFWNTQWGAPKPKWGSPTNYNEHGFPEYSGSWLPWYK